MNLWSLIAHPKLFFRQLFEQPPKFWVPLGIVLGAGWLRYTAYWIWTRNLPSIISLDILQSLSTTPGGTFLISLILIGLISWPLLSWGIYGWIIQLTTRSQCRAWQLAGWSQWPLAAAGLLLVGAAGLWPATGRVIPFSQFVAFRPEAPWLNQYLTWLSLYSQTLSSQVFIQVLFWFVLVGSLWSLWLLYWGVKTLAPQKAVFTTSLLTLWTLIWRVL
ncbi:hypothetical protein [Acaryochloris marina]|uniref:Yip1 domain-containing protein n=1 Tax=Acaryochloris marina (strain MBIC 11017) TaxID=329726 RepID=B0CG69_ACAM1|nr:hypothetical protein [Acaryochloris marina]ABW30622.1 hypothetical protein AM1_5675 [Acaryochloris marina MBIC11017]BDM79410.1 hypothetical protein AM10699_22780 [Acaryochloris marina MBIC10699]